MRPVAAQWTMGALLGAAGALAYAALALADVRLSLVVAAAAPFATFFWWIAARPDRWPMVFLAMALLLPPLPIALGDSGPHPAVFALLAAGFASLLRLREWQWKPTGLNFAIVAFYGALAASLAMALFRAGPVVALQSALRLALAGSAPLLFFYQTAGPGARTPFDPMPRARILFWCGAAAATYACLDFYFQWPPVAGFGPQFIWLDTGVFRRAQGLFYEASTLGNLCAFFLTMVAVALFEPGPVARKGLIVGAAPLLGALVLSYSRASLLNLAVAVAAVAWMQRARIRWVRLLSIVTPALAAAAFLLWRYAGDFLDAYVSRWWNSAAFLFSSTGQVLSGRLDSWQTIADFLTANPESLLLGVGYKTLPYTKAAGQIVIADNMYLSVLAEAGVLGLCALLWMNLAILRAAWKQASSGDASRRFFAQWIFAFWLGECAQMFSGDLLTYWRVLPLYFWALAVAVRE